MPDLERVQQNTPVTLSKQWNESGVAVDPGTVTVTAVRADGTAVAGFGPTTGGSGTGPRTVNLTTAHTALLDRLTVTWSSTLKGTLVSYVEVVGGFLFSIAQGIAQGIPAGEVADRRTAAERDLEDACGVAFVPRYTLETLSGDGGYKVLTRWPLVRTVRSATVEDTALTVDELGRVTVTPTGAYFEDKWILGHRNVVIGYEHGYDYPPSGADRAALALAQRSEIDPNAGGAVIRAEAGEEAFTYAPPGGAGAFGILDVDSFVASHSLKVEVG